MHSGSWVSSSGGNSTCLSSEFAFVWLAGEHSRRAGEGVSARGRARAGATADVKDLSHLHTELKLSTQVRKVQITICGEELCFIHQHYMPGSLVYI